MENMVEDIAGTFEDAFKGKTVLVTGHTGFKGSWLSIWLKELGANVVGYSLDPPTQPSNFEVTNLQQKIISIKGDVRDFAKLNETIQNHRPAIIFHLAAQPIILTGLKEPKLTFETNVIGTLNILESARNSPFIKAVVSITSDKCYKNQELLWGYRENDLLGGDDPYSGSKAMAELLIESYQKSFFRKNKDIAAVASVRAGNVIGGGDFADFRLVPDCMKALMEKQPIIIRNPNSVRPWQHVLVPLSGYLWTAVNLMKDKNKFSEGWNFGPPEHKGVPAKELAENLIKLWGGGSWVNASQNTDKVETNLLRLNWEKAAYYQGWHPVYSIKESLKETVEWFKSFQEYRKNSASVDMYNVCLKQISSYTKMARDHEMSWAVKK